MGTFNRSAPIIRHIRMCIVSAWLMCDTFTNRMSAWIGQIAGRNRLLEKLGSKESMIWMAYYVLALDKIINIGTVERSMRYDE